MQRLLIAALLCLAVGSAHADSLIRNIVTNATLPLPATSFLAIDQNGTDAKLAGTNLLGALSGGTANAFLTAGGAGVAPASVAITGLVLGNGASAPTAYGGTSCTNQFPRSLSALGAATCASVALANDISGFGTGNQTALAVNVGTTGSFLTNGGALVGSSLTSSGLIKTTGGDGSQLEIAGAGLTDFKLSVNASGLYINDVTNSKSPLIVSANSPNSLTIGTSTNAFIGPLTDGANGGTVGSLKLFGNTSGDVTLVAAAAAGTATRFQLPATNGANTNVLQTDGSGNTSWVAAGAGSGTVTQNGSLTTHAPVIGGTNGTSDVKTTAALTNGQLLIGSTGADAAPGTVAAGTANLAWTGGAGTLSLATTVPLSPCTAITNCAGNAAYTVVAADNTKAVSRTNTVTQSDIIPQATGSFGSGFSFGYSAGASVGNTLTATTSTVNGIAGATGIKVGIQQEVGCNSDGTNWSCLLGLPQPATQTGTTVLLDNMTWTTFGTAGAAATGTSAHTLPYLDGSNTFSGTQTFGSVIGALVTDSSTARTVSAADCGKTIYFTNAGAIAYTLLNSTPVGCSIAVMQGPSAGQVTITVGASGATLVSAHAYTKTFGINAIIGLFVNTNSGTNANFVLTGDGA